MPHFEMFNDYLTDTLAGDGYPNASDVGSLIALAFLESGGNWHATYEALMRAADALNHVPTVHDALPVLGGVIDQISTGGWADE